MNDAFVPLSEALGNDVSALKAQIQNLEQRLRNVTSEARAFRQLAEHIDEVFWMTNALGDALVYISPTYEAVWGQTCQSLHEAPGTRLAWVHENDRERVLKAFKRDARHGEYDETYRIDRPDGQIRWIRDRAWPVYDDRGEVYRLAGFACDITAQIAERDRRADLAEQICDGERFAVFAAVGAGIAHDLGQPLTAARMHLARTAGVRLGDIETSRQAIGLAEAEIRRASDIVTHMRDYARQGRPSYSRQPLSRVLDDVAAQSASMLRRDGIRLERDIDDALIGLELVIDRVFVQQILGNLIHNAVRALADVSTTEPARILRITARAGDAQAIEIHVVDNGCGIEPGIDPFRSFGASAEGSLGLGLQVSRSLARSQGGELSLGEADAPMRTCFILRLLHDGHAEHRDRLRAAVNAADA